MTGGEIMKTSERAVLRRRRTQLGKAAITMLSIAGLFVFCPPTASAQTGGHYDLSWSNVSAGGTAMAAGGSHALATSGGQADVSPAGPMLTGGTYQIIGGFLQTADMFPLPVGLSAFSLE